MKKNKELITLYTPEGERLINESEKTPWENYPRPHLVRKSYLSLNGMWDFCTCPEGVAPQYDRQIRVPFVPESVLSGIGEEMPRDARLCYRRRVTLPDDFCKGRVIMHVDAADQIAAVYVNGKEQGEHVGGYERFSMEITDALCNGENTVEIFVTDELDRKVLPYGKQCRARGGMWYTPISGIWQSVWLECVPTSYIQKIETDCNETGATVRVWMNGDEPAGGCVFLDTDQGAVSFPLQNGSARIEIENPILWSPEQPHLYRMAVQVGEDCAESYFALRTLEIKTCNGTPRLCLNGKPYFFHGLLDQGYFSDGIFLPAEPSGYERDILAAKRMGFNMLRKHIKIEPECFYYACDRLGMVVFQDMVNNGDYSFLRDTALPTVGIKRLSDKRMHRDVATREAFYRGMETTVERLKFHPSVCYWTIFNEGWGQFDHTAAYERLKKLDSTRFIDSVSGWFLPPKGKPFASDVESIHVYFKPVRVKKWEKPLVLSEFGGYACKLAGHAFNPHNTYGYRNFDLPEECEAALVRLYEDEIIPLAERGLCADVYTQLTDVEDETNGLLTYDRRVEKVRAEVMLEIAEKLRLASDKQSGEM